MTEFESFKKQLKDGCFAELVAQNQMKPQCILYGKDDSINPIPEEVIMGALLDTKTPDMVSVIVKEYIKFLKKKKGVKINKVVFITSVQSKQVPTTLSKKEIDFEQNNMHGGKIELKTQVMILVVSKKQEQLELFRVHTDPSDRDKVLSVDILCEVKEDIKRGTVAFSKMSNGLLKNIF